MVSICYIMLLYFIWWYGYSTSLRFWGRLQKTDVLGMFWGRFIRNKSPFVILMCFLYRLIMSDYCANLIKSWLMHSVLLSGDATLSKRGWSCQRYVMQSGVVVRLQNMEWFPVWHAWTIARIQRRVHPMKELKGWTFWWSLNTQSHKLTGQESAHSSVYQDSVSAHVLSENDPFGAACSMLYVPKAIHYAASKSSWPFAHDFFTSTVNDAGEAKALPAQCWTTLKHCKFCKISIHRSAFCQSRWCPWSVWRCPLPGFQDIPSAGLSHDWCRQSQHSWTPSYCTWSTLPMALRQKKPPI